MLTKDMTVQIKAGPSDDLPDGIFVGYASCFENVDSTGDIVRKGAFAATLADWEKAGIPIPVLYGHNMHDPDLNIGHVMKAEEDNAGLRVTCQLDLENPKSLQVYRMLKGRRINQMSFAYDVLDGAPVVVDGVDAFELRDLKVYEVSVVQIGANQDTEILSVKQAAAHAERTLQLLKAGRVISAKNEGELRSAHEALGRVLSALDAPEKGKGFTPNEIRASLLDALEDVGKSASGEGPSRHAPSPDLVSRGASQTPPAAASAVSKAMLDIQIEELGATA